MSQSIQARPNQATEDRRNLMDRRVMINFSTDQLKRVGVQVAEHFMRDDKQGAWQLMQTYNLSGQGHYQLMAYALQRLATYENNPQSKFIDWIANIHNN
jgi:hypothetical protein